MTNDLARLIEGLPPLHYSLPYIFPDSISKIDSIEMHCAGCDRILRSTDMKGEFTAFNRHSVSLRAFGICRTCQTVTPVESKFASDGTCLQKVKAGWMKGRWGQNPTNELFARFKALFM